MILVTSDFHLQTSGMFARPTGDGLTTRAVEGLEYIRWLGEYVRSHKEITTVLHCGDMFTQKTGISVALYNSALDELLDLSHAVEFLYMPGNHDKLMKSDKRHYNMYAISMATGIQTLDENGIGIEDDFGHIEVVGILPPFTEYILHKRESKTRRRILVVHENIIGGEYESGRKIDSGVSPKVLRSYAQDNEFDIVFGGDIHKPQKIQGKPMIYLVGAPMQFNFGDVGDRGFWLYDPKENVAKFESYPQGPEYITLTDEDVKSGQVPDINIRNYYRFRIKETQHLKVARTLAKAHSNIAIEFIPEAQDQIEGVQLFAPEAIIAPYVHTFKDKYNNKQVKQLIDLGLEAVRHE